MGIYTSAPDFAKVSDYAKEAVSALVANGVINGKNGYVAPFDLVSKAEVAIVAERIKTAE